MKRLNLRNRPMLRRRRNVEADGEQALEGDPNADILEAEEGALVKTVALELRRHFSNGRPRGHETKGRCPVRAQGVRQNDQHVFAGHAGPRRSVGMAKGRQTVGLKPASRAAAAPNVINVRLTSIEEF